MKSLNRRYTEALEKTAQAEKRAAKAEETIARHLATFLGDVDEEAPSAPARPSSGTTPPKKQPPKK